MSKKNDLNIVKLAILMRLDFFSPTHYDVPKQSMRGEDGVMTTELG